MARYRTTLADWRAAGPRRRCCACSAPAQRRPRGAEATFRRLGFTLIEVLVSIAIISILVTITTLAFRGLTNRSVLAQARNALLVHAQVARGYALANRVETMLVVNPFSGRFEIWYLNPPAQGGIWDPLSVSATRPDGYAFAPVLDASARLPVDGDDRPVALVSPIDYAERPTAGSAGAQNYANNMVWTAICFDENAELVIRTRRIATRPYLSGGYGAPDPNANRLPDGSPNLTLVPLVTVADTPITSTRGVVVSDLIRVKSAVDVTTVTPQDFVDHWLMLTRPGGQFSAFAMTVLLNRYSADQLAGDH